MDSRTMDTSDHVEAKVGLFEQLGAAGKSVEADVTGPVIDKSNVIGAVARFIRTDVVPANGRRTPKHTFRIPGEEGTNVFQLWGDAALNGSLRKVKPNELLGLIYDGKGDDGGRDVHKWRVVLVTVSGEKLNTLMRECDPVYRAIREAIATAKQSNQLAPRDREEAPPVDDHDAPSWARGI